MSWRITLTIITIATKLSEGGFVPTRPIYEVTGEVTPPFGNPLSGGSPEIVKRNTMMHVRNQRRIFDLEMMERRKAQQQQINSLESQDSYLKAYHEQHEQFHLDLERKMLEQMDQKEINTRPQKGIKNSTFVEKPNFKKDSRIRINPNQINRKEDVRVDKDSVFVDNTREKRVDSENAESTLSEKTSRSIEYDSGYFSPMQTHQEQNSEDFNNRVAKRLKQGSPKIIYYRPQKLNTADVSALTSAALMGSNAHNKFSQISAYNNFGSDIESSLTALIGKQPEDQLIGLSHLLQQSNSNHKLTSLDLKNANINLKASALDVPMEYYHKFDHEPAFTTPLNSYQQYIYGQESDAYTRDHTPITENVEDVADPVKPPSKYTPLPTAFTYVTEIPTTSTLSSNFYKVEVANHVHHGGSGISVYKTTPSYSYTSGHDNLHYASQYEFGYRVRDPHTGNDYGHSEVSNGHSAAGSYHVLLPDGRLQKVRYHAGPEGFNAQVTYD